MNIRHFEITAMGHTADLKLLQYPNVTNTDKKHPVIILCPGGGYTGLSPREADVIGLQFMAKGYHAAVLTYTCAPAARFPVALYQLAGAVATLRQNADELRIDENTIIVSGFSAGGHLAASLGVFWNNGEIMKDCPWSAEQRKPNLEILGYPVISSGDLAHKGSFKALLGDKFDEDEAMTLVSLEKQVNADTPATFLWHTWHDVTVPPENSMLYASALRKNNVPLELHIYEEGPHGIATGNHLTNDVMYPAGEGWVELAHLFVKDHTEESLWNYK